MLRVMNHTAENSRCGRLKSIESCRAGKYGYGAKGADACPEARKATRCSLRATLDAAPVLRVLVET